jgi:hypothetical protein
MSIPISDVGDLPNSLWAQPAYCLMGTRVQ